MLCSLVREQVGPAMTDMLSLYTYVPVTSGRALKTERKIMLAPAYLIVYIVTYIGFVLAHYVVYTYIRMYSMCTVLYIVLKHYRQYSCTVML